MPNLLFNSLPIRTERIGVSNLLWRYTDEREDGFRRAVFLKDEVGADLATFHGKRAVENAETVVHCVNSHEAMREALEELVAEHDNTDDLPRSPDGHICGYKPDTFGIQLARQALEATDRGTG